MVVYVLFHEKNIDSLRENNEEVDGVYLTLTAAMKAKHALICKAQDAGEAVYESDPLGDLNVDPCRPWGHDWRIEVYEVQE